MNTFPANAIPQYGPPMGFPQNAMGSVPQGMMAAGQMQGMQVPGLPAGVSMPQGMPQGMPMMADPQHLAMMQQQQQQFIAQQQQLAAQHMMMRPGMQAQQKKKQKPGRPMQQMTPRMVPPGSEQYLKNAVAAPGHPGMAAGMEVEPWADSLDELDPRELAMSRFRARNEVMAEIFGPERVQDIPTRDADAWSGFGPNSESLEAKVTSLEAANAELETKFDAEIESFRKRLQAADAGEAA